MKLCNCGNKANILLAYNGKIFPKCWKCYREIQRVIKLVDKQLNN